MPPKARVRFCAYEGEPVPASEFRTIAGSLVHFPPGDVPHRPDGLTVDVDEENGTVTVTVSSSVEAVADAFDAETL